MYRKSCMPVDTATQYHNIRCTTYNTKRWCMHDYWCYTGGKCSWLWLCTPSCQYAPHTHTHTLTNTEWEGDALEKRRTRILNMRKGRNLGTHFPERVVWSFLSLFHIWTCSGHNTLLTHCTSMNCILWRSKKATTAHSHQGKHLPVIPQMTYITTKTLSENTAQNKQLVGIMPNSKMFCEKKTKKNNQN